MNKQEAIEKIEKEKSTLNGWEELTRNNALDAALTIVRKLDEPEKPVVPQFVADWYEENKDDLEYNLYKLCTDFREQKLRADLNGWFSNDDNKCIETLVMMHKFGYKVDKEKLYTVELPNPNGGTHLVLCKDCDGKLFVETFLISDKGFEVFDVQEAFIHDLKGMAASYWCNVVKYILRFQNKNGVEDLKKAKYYLEKLIDETEQ